MHGFNQKDQKKKKPQKTTTKKQQQSRPLSRLTGGELTTRRPRLLS